MRLVPSCSLPYRRKKENFIKMLKTHLWHCFDMTMTVWKILCLLGIGQDVVVSQHSLLEVCQDPWGWALSSRKWGDVMLTHWGSSGTEATVTPSCSLKTATLWSRHCRHWKTWTSMGRSYVLRRLKAVQQGERRATTLRLTLMLMLTKESPKISCRFTRVFLLKMSIFLVRGSAEFLYACDWWLTDMIDLLFWFRVQTVTPP